MFAAESIAVGSLFANGIAEEIGAIPLVAALGAYKVIGSPFIGSDNMRVGACSPIGSPFISGPEDDD